MRINRYIALVVLVLLPQLILAQEDEVSEWVVGSQYPVYSQYLLDGLIINPAYAGTRDALSISISGRKRMLGFEGENTMASLSLHTPLKKERVALGLSINHISFGVTKQTSLYGYYAFHINTDKGKWSLGIKGGVDMLTSDFRGIIGHDQSQPDPAFSGEVESYMMPNVGVGVYYVTPKFFAGAAVPSLITYLASKEETDFSYGFESAYYDVLISTGALFSISENVMFKPSVMAKYSLTNLLRLDLNGNVILYDFLWLGASWRIGEDALVGLLELQLTQQLRLGYSYDYNMGDIGSFVGGTHEVALRFDFGKKVTAASPRYF